MLNRVALGCWPIAGITSLGTSESQSIETVQQALRLGIDHFDTAFSYGYNGESDRILRKAIASSPAKETERIASNAPFVATKVGQSWTQEKTRIIDGRPESLIEQARISRERLRIETLDLLYLHSIDPNVPLNESAGAIKEICDRGWARLAGVCNVDIEQAIEFSRHCPLHAIQIPFNMFQQSRLMELRQFADEQGIFIVAYWVLMKGLLAGHLDREKPLTEIDVRRTYPIFQGERWTIAHHLMDALRSYADQYQVPVSQLVVAWGLRRNIDPTRTSGGNRADIVLVGCKTPAQMAEVAQAASLSLAPEDWDSIESLVEACSRQYNAVQ